MTDSNEVNGTDITAKIRKAHYENNTFVKAVVSRTFAVIRRRFGMAEQGDGRGAEQNRSDRRRNTDEDYQGKGLQ